MAIVFMLFLLTKIVASAIVELPLYDENSLQAGCRGRRVKGHANKIINHNREEEISIQQPLSRNLVFPPEATNL
jgi:hypothetical protein